LFTFFYSNLKIGIKKFFWQNLIVVFRNMEIFESLCFNTWRFKNLHGLNTEIFESPYFNTQRFKNLHVLKHAGFVRQTVHIFQSPCFNTWRFKNLRVQNTQKFESSCFNTQRFKNIHVLNHENSKTSMFYTHRFFFKSPITRWYCNRWWKRFWVWIRGLGTTNLWKKQSSKISCYCPFKGTLAWDFRALVFFHESIASRP